jgi:hypothetical protein
MFTLDKVVPWGRSYDEYCRMFDLSADDLHKRILGCGDGPAGFNAVATARGVSVVSCDPLYAFCAAEIRARIDETAAGVLAQTEQNRDQFVWTDITSIEALHRVRMDAMELFLADYETGKSQGRYVDAALPHLPFGDNAFDLALCSHFLFLYSEQLGEQFHHSAALELARIADEVRVFPLLALGGNPSRFLPGVMSLLQAAGYEVSVEPVAYEFQRGGNEMMRIIAGTRRHT